jgi:hypothetical protein
MFWDSIKDFLTKKNQAQPQTMNPTVQAMARQIDEQHDAMQHPDLPPAVAYSIEQQRQACHDALTRAALEAILDGWERPRRMY